MSAILVTPIFSQIGVILVSVSGTDFTRIEMSPSGKTYFFILLSCNNNGFDRIVSLSER